MESLLGAFQRFEVAEKVAFENKFLFFKAKIRKIEEVYTVYKPTKFYEFADEKQELRSNVDFCNNLIVLYGFPAHLMRRLPKKLFILLHKAINHIFFISGKKV